MSPPGAPLREGDEITLDIADLAFGGRGVARVSGFVVFVKGALPGESARVRVARVKASYAEGDCLQVLRPSRDRVTPPCRHYGECGGCDLQHLSPPAQAEAKRRQVIAMLCRLGGLDEPPVQGALTAGEPTTYRFRMDFDWGTGPAGRPALGLHRYGHPAEILTIENCLLMPEMANEIRAFIGRRAETLRLQPWDAKRRRGLLRRIGIRMARSTDEILAILETGRGDPPALLELARDLRRVFPRIVGVVRREFDRHDRPSGESILHGRDHLFERVEGDLLKVPAWTFFQPNAAAAGALRAAVLEALVPGAGEAILELYCGVGLFTLPVARAARQAVAVDASREAVSAARDNAASAGLPNARFMCRDVVQALPGLLQELPWDSVLLDPPRTGLPPAAIQAIAGADVRRVVYVSCDPATMARDLRLMLLGGGMSLRSVRPLDLFPQTHHVECVARLEREPVSGRRAGAGPERPGPSTHRTIPG